MRIVDAAYERLKSGSYTSRIVNLVGEAMRHTGKGSLLSLYDTLNQTLNQQWDDYTHCHPTAIGEVVRKFAGLDSSDEALDLLWAVSDGRDFVESYPIQRRTETYWIGKTIPEKMLRRHETAIKALLSTLDALTDRSKYNTYEKLDTLAREVISADGWRDGYFHWDWNPTGLVPTIKHGAGLGQYIKCSKPGHRLGWFADHDGVRNYPPNVHPLIGSIKEGQAIYLCPFLRSAAYGVRVIVTRDGWVLE